ncbi:MAG: F0F1 ATP synthase subunit A [Myxococcota bacterium]
MEHGASWLSFLPGYQQIEAYLQAISHGVLFGNALAIQHSVASILVAIVLLAVAVVARRDLNRAGDAAIVPDPNPSVRNFIEVSLEWLYGQTRQICGKEAARYFPLIGTLALFIFFSNVLGLIPGFVPPTNNWNTNFACAGFVFLYYNYQGLRVNGWGHIRHLANPAGVWWGWFLAPLLFPIELVSVLARPFSLTVRLAANMMGDHAVVGAFLGLMPILIPIPFLLLGLVVCVIQTMVFVLLTMVYIGVAVADQHADQHNSKHGREAAHAAA